MPITILIVDDEETLSHFLGQSLEAEGYQVLRAATARDGLSLLNDRQIDLVLLDMRLPDLDGLEVLRRMPRMGEKPWVIVLTSDGGSGQARGTEIREEVMRLGAQAYLEKPLDLGVLKETIAGILGTETRKPPTRKRVGVAEEPPLAVATKPPAKEVETRHLKKRIEELEQLQILSEALAAAQDVSQAAELALATAHKYGKVQRGALWVRIPSGQKMALVAEKNIPREARPLLGEEELAWRLIAWSASKEPLLIQGDESQALASWIRALVPSAPACLLPLPFGGQTIGVMLLFNAPGRLFSPQQLSRLSGIASTAGQALGRVLMVEEFRARRQKLLVEVASRSAALESLTFGVLVTDREGRIVLANPATERLLGYAAEELLGQGLGAVLGGIDLEEAWKEGIFLAHRERNIQSKDGREIAVEVDFTLRRDEEGAISGLVAVLRESGVAEVEEEKEADLGEISRILAHEIRNPLAGIGAGVQHLLSKLPAEDGQRESLEMILREAERINHIIEEILILTRPIPLNFAAVNIALILEEAWQVNKGRLPSEMSIEKSLPQDLPLVYGDAQRLRQALANILQAAQSGGGVLQLSAGVTEEEIEIEIRGPGEIRKSGEMTSATGLGLAAARRIIEAHGGEMEVEADGFIVHLPVSPD
ncbi:MAG: response regulator [Chloroflexi bacterium]|nr:response regulator [Chloroflexota bacterium]